MGSQGTTARVHCHARISAIGRHQDDAGRWRAAILAGFTIGAGLIVPLWLQGYATGKFWILWPLAPLIIVVAALAAIQDLTGRLGGLVVMIRGGASAGGPGPRACPPNGTSAQPEQLPQ